MPCRDAEKNRMKARLAEMIQLSQERRDEKWQEEYMAVAAEIKALDDWEENHPHLLVQNDDGESILHYFKTEREKDAFALAWAVQQANIRAAKYMKKKEVLKKNRWTSNGA
jgi:hypothetical protein